MTLIRSEIIGHGHFVPAKVLTNDDLSKIVETNDEWISTRTGIRQRNVVVDELTSDLAFNAARMAVRTAGIAAEDIDLVVLATVTPDNTTPATAAKVANRLGVKVGTPAFDLSAACSGFVYAMTMADNMIRLGQIKTALIIGAESLSKITDWNDRNTCVLFGDGAGAVVFAGQRGAGRRFRQRCSGNQALCRRNPVGQTADQRRCFQYQKCRVYLDGRQRSIQICH